MKVVSQTVELCWPMKLAASQLVRKAVLKAVCSEGRGMIGQEGLPARGGP